MSELDNEWMERNDHPLMNNVILKIIFKHLRVKDLKKLRLVCKTWNTHAIPFTRNAFEVKFYGNNSMETFVGLFRSNNLGIPFARFEFGAFCRTEGTGQEFLQLCGDTIKSIRCTIGNGKDFRVEDLSQLLKSTPKLEIFDTPSIIGCLNEGVVKLFPEGTGPKLPSLKKLTLSRWCYARGEIYCPTYLEELITAAENISILGLADYSASEEIEGEVKSPRSVEVH